MKKIFSIIIVALCLTACNRPDSHDLDNNDIFFKDYKGQWLVLNYWASWCTSCYKEVAELNALSEDNNIALFGINFDHIDVTEMRTFAQKVDVHYPLLRTDPGKQFGIKDPIEALPATFIISPDRKQLKQLLGPQSKQAILDTINAMAG